MRVSSGAVVAGDWQAGRVCVGRVDKVSDLMSQASNRTFNDQTFKVDEKL